MANYYVWNGATGTGTGATWANAITTLDGAMSGKAVGDVFYVAHDHVQTQGSALTVSSVGTEASPCRIYCADRAGSVPPVSADLRTTAQVTTTAAFGITLAGSVSECYGIIFSAGTSTGAANLIVGSTAGRSWRLVSCKLVLGATTTSNRINIGGLGSQTVLENCTVQFAAVGQGIAPIGRVTIRSTTSTTFIQGATIPTILFAAGASAGVMLCEGVDLSNLGSGKFLYLGTPTTIVSAIFKDCKLGASVGMISGVIPAAGAIDLTLIRCDSGDTNYRTERHNYMGSQTVDTTVVRSGGATDGTTPIAWKITTNSVSGLSNNIPFESLPISIWNETVGSPVTVTIEAAYLASSYTPKNNEVWIECFYLGTSGFPLGSKATSGAPNMIVASGTTYSTSSSSWGGSPPSKWSMSATFTPQEKGPITIYIKHGWFPNAVFYFDPKPVIT